MPPAEPAESDIPDLRAAIRQRCRMDEAEAVRELLQAAACDAAMADRIQSRARRFIETARMQGRRRGGLDSFLHEYDLSSQEGVVMLCLAEALLRIPDTGTVDALIRDVLGRADWQRHLGQADSLLVNAATWTLLLTGRLLRPAEIAGLAPVLQRVLARSSEPVVREALRQGVRLLGRHFVLGETLDEALARAHELEGRGYRFSYDRLGEAALTAADAQRYCDGYAATLAALRGAADAGVSVKLSALHPRFEYAQRERLRRELVPRLRDLALQAKAADLALTVDAEEAERLEPTLDVFAAVFRDAALGDWEGFGLAVQAYQKRAPAVIDWL
ncbi:MAG TPA: proline dehydrogenase family protein, partial [Nevskiales bacterium]|nr:proline dehydrogenase family protein [Nevskiales bacterium]